VAAAHRLQGSFLGLQGFPHLQCTFALQLRIHLVGSTAERAQQKTIKTDANADSTVLMMRPQVLSGTLLCEALHLCKRRRRSFQLSGSE